MELAPTQFARIEGRQVSVSVSSPDEAKLALKELRHKKRELLLWKRGLVKERKRAAQGSTRRGERAGFWQRLLQRKKGIFGGLMGFYRYFAKRRVVRKIEHLDKELEHLDELIHKLDDCVLQVQGRLLQHK